MIDRTEINAIPGWYLDSLDIEHPEYVTWYEIDPAGNERVCGTGYYYNLASGEPLPSGYTYYAVVNIPGTAVRFAVHKVRPFSTLFLPMQPLRHLFRRWLVRVRTSA